jgi:RNA methyltransferase, TrmH family
METVNLEQLLCTIQPFLMIGKKKLKLIKSLAQKKYRLQQQSFLAEGDKIVPEVLKSDFLVKELFATPQFLREHKNSIEKAARITETGSEEIKKASLLQQPQNCIAICELPRQPELPQNLEGLCIFLDGIQDPGNLGTIIRTCDWFGVDYLFCAPDTADVYNPKVIQATMGSFTRVKTIYTSLNALIPLAETTPMSVYGTFLEGQNIYTAHLPENALVILGNEGSGIRPEVTEYVTNKLNIPAFGKKKVKAESLNVAVTTGIICSEFARRRMIIRNEN